MIAEIFKNDKEKYGILSAFSAVILGFFDIDMVVWDFVVADFVDGILTFYHLKFLLGVSSYRTSSKNSVQSAGS